MGTLRARLVLSLLAVTGVVVVLLGAFVYTTVRASALDRVDGTLGAVASRVAQQVRVSEPPNQGLAGQAQALGATDYFIELHRRGGAVVPLAERLRDPQLSPPAVPDDLSSIAGSPVTVPPMSGEASDYRMLVRGLPRQQGFLVVAIPLTGVDATLQRLLAIEVGGSLLALVVLGASAAALVSSGLRPLEQMARDADAIAAGDLGRRVSPAGGPSETGRLGRALNTMLDRLEEAFGTERAAQERLRRFVADASHELRTPVAAMLGYSDLHRQGAVSGPAEADRVMERVGHEALRMKGLVDDLLLLASVDEPGHGEASRFDLAEVAGRAVEAARAVEPGRPITTSLGPDAVVIGEEEQLRRVMDNLLGNVRMHTPPGTAVLVRVDRSADLVAVEVSDRGPGIPTDAQPHVFGRFYRGEPSRSRATGGAGLGLSIVAAVARSHGGDVQLRSDGSGTTIRVRLPAAAV